MSFQLDLICMKYFLLMRTSNLRVLDIQCKLKKLQYRFIENKFQLTSTKYLPLIRKGYGY